MNLEPATPEQLSATLSSIFPGYVYEVEDSPTLNFHSLLQDFIVYFGENNATFHERQLQKLAMLINAAVEAGGTLQDAFDTCFLEHLHQVRARKPLAQFLSKAARTRMHA